MGGSCTFTRLRPAASGPPDLRLSRLCGCDLRPSIARADFAPRLRASGPPDLRLSHAFGCREAAGRDGRREELVVALVLVGVTLAKSPIAWSNRSLRPRYAEIAIGSPERACARARAQPQSRAYMFEAFRRHRLDLRRSLHVA